jgi:nitrilase
MGTHPTIAALTLGVGRAALEETLKYTQERVSGGKPIIKHQAVGLTLAEMAMNLEAARRLIGEAAREGAQLVALPEYFCFMGRDDREKLAIAESAGDGPIQRALADAARTHGVWIVGGTLPLRIPGTDDAVLNASCVFAPDGRQAARYDKMHLFRYDNGRERYDEGRVLRAGDAPVAVDAGGWRVGLSVCYDLRFPELYRAMGEVALIVVPAAFTHTTGMAHWEVLLRARAIENQCYVIAPAQGGVHENGRRTWGHSMIVDPWGEVLGVRDEGEGVVVGEMSRERIEAVRTQLPALTHRRL